MLLTISDSSSKAIYLVVVIVEQFFNNFCLPLVTIVNYVLMHALKELLLHVTLIVNYYYFTTFFCLFCFLQCFNDICCMIH